MTLPVKLSPQAVRHLRQAKKWWAENRPKAPGAVEDDSEQAVDLIADLPSVGEPVQHSTMPGIRRLLLDRIQYHVYYLHNAPKVVSRFSVSGTQVAAPALG